MLVEGAAARVFLKDTLIKGRPAQLQCVNVLGQTYAVERRVVTLLGLEDDWYQDVRDPAAGRRGHSSEREH